MSKKLLTEDLILDKLEEKGIAEPRSIDVSEMQKVILEYYDAEIKHDYSYANMYFSVMSTADGYEIRDGLTIHVDEHYQDEYGFEDAIVEVYEDYWNDQKEEIENELIEDGYEWKEED